MEIVSCVKCGKIFNYMRGPRICPSCEKEMEEKFTEVKKYVYDHPHVDMNELSTAMEVSVKQIKKWIREERLSFTDDSPIGLNCENCGATIKTGRFCKACKDKLATKLENASGKRGVAVTPVKKTTTENKMRFLDQ